MNAPYRKYVYQHPGGFSLTHTEGFGAADSTLQYLHRNAGFLLIYFLRGTGSITSGDRHYPVGAGDVVLLRGLPGVKTALGLGRATLANIRLSLFWAFAYNVLLVPVAAGLLLLFGGPAMSPMLAGAAMSLSSVSVVTNALRLRKFEG